LGVASVASDVVHRHQPVLDSEHGQQRIVERSHRFLPHRSDRALGEGVVTLEDEGLAGNPSIEVAAPSPAGTSLRPALPHSGTRGHRLRGLRVVNA
jgi:hypothetical protein